MTAVPTVTLNNGVQIPQLGFGVYQVKPAETVSAVLEAFRVGYRHIDTAQMYRNEAQVGEAIRQSGLARGDLFITSKLNNGFHDHDAALRAFDGTLEALGLEQIDLFLINWPVPAADRYVEAWQTLIELQQQGHIRSIGVSNFDRVHIERIVAETGVAPAVNQVELHPLFPQSAQHAYDEAHGVRDEAWSPFGRGSDFLSDPTLAAVAAAHGRTPAQVILRWDVQRGVVPLPKSADPARQAQNLAVFDFELTDDEVATVTALGRPDGRLWGQDPAVYEEF